MILLVNDASILIDLLKTDLIEKFFELNCKFYITDFILAEIQEENVARLHQYIHTDKLKKKTFDFNELYEYNSLFKTRHLLHFRPFLNFLNHTKLNGKTQISFVFV